MTITVEQNVPLPAARSKYPFDQLVAGSSFAVPLDTSVKESVATRRLYSAALMWAKANSREGLKFVVRVRREDESGKAIKPETRLWAITTKEEK